MGCITVFLSAHLAILCAVIFLAPELHLIKLATFISPFMGRYSLASTNLKYEIYSILLVCLDFFFMPLVLFLCHYWVQGFSLLGHRCFFINYTAIQSLLLLSTKIWIQGIFSSWNDCKTCIFPNLRQMQ